EPSDVFRASFTGDYTRAKSGGQSTRLLSLNASPSSPGLPAPNNVLSEVAVENGLSLAPADAVASLAAARLLMQQYVDSPGPAGSNFWDSGSGLDQYSDVELWGAALNLRYALTGAVDLKSITGYRKLKRATLFDLDGTPYTILHPFQAAEADFWSQELQLTY